MPRNYAFYKAKIISNTRKIYILQILLTLNAINQPFDKPYLLKCAIN